MIELASGDYAMIVDPTCGGSVRSLRWRGLDVLRPQSRPGVLESASFPLVPFCNRLADSRIPIPGRTIRLFPNHPARADEPVMHGFGWVNAWQVASAGPASTTLFLGYPGTDWPWPFRAEQQVSLDNGGVTMRLTLTNLAQDPMPAGLGFHPYFPRDQATFHHGLHLAEMPTGGPLDRRDRAIDWWCGRVGERIIDHAFAGRDGALSIVWRNRGIGARIDASSGLACTHVYVPPDEDFFCLEPVSHLPVASNSPEHEWPLRRLAPGETWSEWMHIAAYPVATP